MIDTTKTLDHDSEDDCLELPSCIESLVSSSEQLRELAEDIGQYYIRSLLCYGYASEPNNWEPAVSGFVTIETNNRDLSNRSLAKSPSKSRAPTIEQKDLDINKLLKDDKTLNCMHSLLEFLPFLDQLGSFVERCFATIESTLKRGTYYLNKAATRKVTSDMIDDELQLSPDTKIHPIFVALMDLLYAIVSLDKTIQSHTNICQSLSMFKAVCQLVIDSPDTSSLDDLGQIPKNKLKSLVDFIGNIQLTLCNESRTIFQQCIEHLQHLNLILSLDKTNKGYKNLCEHFEDFLAFYGENLIEPIEASGDPTTFKTPQTVSIYLVNLNIIPTIYMTSASQRVFGLSSLFILYSWIFKKCDKRIIRIMMQTLQRYKIINLTHLFGSNCYLLLNEFLTKHLPDSLLDSKVLKQLHNQGELLLKLNINQEFDKFTMKVVPWLVKFKAETLRATANSSLEDLDILRKQIHLFQRGLNMAEEINHTIKSIITIYLHYNKPMTKNNLIPLFRLVALLKSIEASLRGNQKFVNNCAICIQHLARNMWRKLMLSARKRSVSLRFSERKLDTTSSLKLSSICLRADNFTTNRGRSTMSLCLSMLISSLDNQEISGVNQLLDILTPENVCERLNSIANCGYLYWNLPTFSTYYNHAFEEDPCALDEIHYFHMALNDIPSLFSLTSTSILNKVDCGWLNCKRDEFLKKVGDELMEQFKNDFLDKICQELEIELRLQTHRDLNLDGHNPFRRHLYNFKQMFASSKISQTNFRIFYHSLAMRYYVEQHLNRVCYNLTSITPHDWFTYDSMINLARHKYNLQFVNSQLPTQTLDYGLDLLDITRNLALFVSRYGYDLTNQLFIEKCSNRLSTSSAASMFSGVSMFSASASSSSSNHSLNVFQIRHIAISIQTHGYGLLNSSVNCTYQVMKRLINLFSKQISDDKLRAVLTKEHQRLSVNSGGIQCNITFDKANRMAKRFKLNTADISDAINHSYAVGVDLDSLRQSITQLGNLLGFIRMLKSGALNCASKSVDYLPDLNDLSILRLDKFVKTEFQGYHSDSLRKATQNFDQCLADFDENFSPKTNYFLILINLFSNILSSSNVSRSKRDSDGQQQQTATEVKVAEPSLNENGDEQEGDVAQQQQLPPKSTDRQPDSSADKRDHLRLFFLLVPALTINFIDYIINCKERVSSRSSVARLGALISDDGFSMGVAFLLTILNQTQEFAKLEWFKQVRYKLEEDKEEVEKRIEDSRYEESLKQTSSMTLRRLNRFRVEYDGLDYTLSTALLFFRSSTFAPSS